MKKRLCTRVRGTTLAFFWLTVCLLMTQPVFAGDEATFISETIPDNTVIPPSNSFTKTWTLRNSGTTTWTTGRGYTLNFVSGNQMGAPSYVTLTSSVPPHGQVTFSVTMTAPTNSGTYTNDWRMSNASYTQFGPTFSVKIVVNASGTRTLTVASSNPNSGVVVAVSPNDNHGQNGGGTSFTRIYSNNTVVTLLVSPTNGANNFQKWQIDGANAGTNTRISVTMSANHTLAAVYAPMMRTLTVASSNPSSGVAVAVTPNDTHGQNGGETSFTRIYNNNTVVTLLASTIAGGNNFQKWQIGRVDSGTSRQISVTMSADHTLTAVYEPVTCTLTVASSNPNSGVAVAASPNDNNGQGGGGAPFTLSYSNNTVVTLLASTTSGGNNFQKWELDGVDAGTSTMISVPMSAHHTLTAVYVAAPPPIRTLTVASANPSSGITVTASPNDNDGKASGTTQFALNYNNNTVVTLTAPAISRGKTFKKWQKDGVDLTTDLAALLIMDANHTLTAVYAPVTVLPCDMVVEGIPAISPNPVTAGNAITVDYTVKNQGVGTAGSSHTKIQIKNSSGVEITAPTFTENSISTSSSVSQTRSITIPSSAEAGTYTAYVILDNLGQLNQSDTTNDLTPGVNFSVLGGTISPLAIDNISAYQRSDTKRVTVSYTLSGANANISLVFSSNGGASWDIVPLVSALSGDYGSGVVAGQHTVEWQADQQLSANTFSNNFRARLVASITGYAMTNTSSPFTVNLRVRPVHLMVTGKVLHATTRQPLSGVSISLAGQNTMTLEDGSYCFTNVVLANGNIIMAGKSGFATYTGALSISAGSKQLQNLLSWLRKRWIGRDGK